MMNSRQRRAINRVFNTLIEVERELSDPEMIQKVKLAAKDCVMVCSKIIDEEEDK